MKKFLLYAGVAAFAFASNANALEVNPYVSAKLSYNWAKDEAKSVIKWDGGGYNGELKLHKNVWGSHFAAGAKARAIRTEVEWNISQDTKKKDPKRNDRYRLQNHSLLLNAYYDINTCTKWTPYVGAGMGVALLKLTEKNMDSGFKASIKSYNFAWQIGAGVAYDLTKNVALDAGYRYIDAGAAVANKTTDADWKGREKFDTAAHEVYFGARYTF